MDWIKNYEAKNKKEAEDKDNLLRLDERLISVDRSAPYHYTTSSMVLDREKNKLLMIYHKIYRSWSWPGGHVEEGEELFYSALRELYEETGLRRAKPLSEKPIALELMPVASHERKGEKVDSHFHANRMWVPVDKLDAFVAEDHMLPIYRELLERMRSYD